MKFHESSDLQGAISQAARKPFLDAERVHRSPIQDLFSGLGVLPSIYGSVAELLWS
jgi:hypothetical protein